MAHQSDPERSIHVFVANVANDNILKSTVTILVEETLVDNFL